MDGFDAEARKPLEKLYPLVITELFRLELPNIPPNQQGKNKHIIVNQLFAMLNLVVLPGLIGFRPDLRRLAKDELSKSREDEVCCFPSTMIRNLQY